LHTARILALLTYALPAAAASYSTYIGDSYPYTVTAIAVDRAGNTFITGTRQVSQTISGYPSSPDVFVSKLDPSGNLTLLTTITGKASDYATSVALDPSGNIYVAGYTDSTDFPLLHPLQSTIPTLHPTGFLVKLDPSGAMIYSTYLGGTTGWSWLTAVVADATGSAYVTGSTFATDYPSTPGLPAAIATSLPGGANSVAFFAKISPGGDKLVYAGGLAAGGRACGLGSSCFTSTVTNSGTAIAVDPAGSAYIAGNTFGSGLPTTPGVLQPSGIGAFVAKVNAAGTAMAYVTLLGTANYAPPPVSVNSDPATFVSSIAVDSSGDAYIVGSTSDPNFPATASAFQPKPAFTAGTSPYQVPPSDAFVAKLNPSGTAMVWSTFLGGSGADRATALALDSNAKVWVVGFTSSSDFPQAPGGIAGDEFLAEFSPDGTALAHSQLFPANTVAAGIAVDATNTVHLAGATGLISANAQPNATSTQIYGVANSAGGTLAGRVTPGELISIYGANIGPAAALIGSFNAGGYLPVSLGGVQLTIDGIPAPLLYVSASQINTVAPVELNGSAPVSLQLTVGTTPLPPFRLVIDPAIPAVFRLPGGNAAAINQDGTLNSQSNPAKAGSIVSVWATGVGLPVAGANGQLTTTAGQMCDCQIEQVYIASEAGPTSVPPAYQQIQYAGPAPGTVTGVVQLNFQVTGSGEYNLIANYQTSPIFSVYVSQ
jgi:uncharacterized protein (TIGR03437 family)